MITEEEKNKRKGMVISAGVHALLFILFLFFVAWRPQDPPPAEIGIEINYGTSNVGTGDIQPETPANENTSEEEAAPEELPEEVVEEVIEESQPVEEVSEPVEEQAVNTPVTEQDSPDIIPEEKEEVKEPDPKPEEKKEEVKEKKPAKVENKEPKKPADGADGDEGESKEAEAANHGDNTDEVGDKGDESGSIDSRALYGNSGGANGEGLQLSGWIWDSKPEVNDDSNQNGRIVFDIEVDDQGELTNISVSESTVNPAVLRIYRAEVEKLTFSRKDFNSIAPPISRGKITFIITAK